MRVACGEGIVDVRNRGGQRRARTRRCSSSRQRVPLLYPTWLPAGKRGPSPPRPGSPYCRRQPRQRVNLLPSVRLVSRGKSACSRREEVVKRCRYIGASELSVVACSTRGVYLTSCPALHEIPLIGFELLEQGREDGQLDSSRGDQKTLISAILLHFGEQNTKYQQQ